MNVLMIAQYFPPDWNGTCTRAYNAARGLVLHGCNVSVITAFPHYPHGYAYAHHKRRLLYFDEIDGIKVIRTWVPNLAHYPIHKRVLLHLSFMLSSLLGLLFIRKVDIIFAMNPSLFSFFPAFIFGLFFRKKIIRNVDDLWPEVFYDFGIIKYPLIKRILDFAANLSYRLSSAIITISEGYIETLLVKYRIPKEKIVFIEHGVDTAKFRKSERNFSVNNKNKIIMYSGNINVGYDFETVIKAAKLLESEPVNFIIRGTGELSDKLPQLIKEYQAKNIELRRDFLSKEELAFLLNSADIFLLPLNLQAKVADQGLPTKLLEYQALGRPIVCISAGEAGRYIIKTQSGLVAKTNQPQELARLVMQLVHDCDLANKLGNNGFNNIKNNLTLQMIGERLMCVISKCSTTRSIQSK
jgi:glycosyltransferase involved in cell wall biosynthesis